jgi:hypothetical protein
LTQKLWIYDLRTNRHLTLKTNPLRREDLNELKPVWTFLGSKTTAWLTATTYPPQRLLRKKLWKTCKPRWSSSS